MASVDSNNILYTFIQEIGGRRVINNNYSLKDRPRTYKVLYEYIPDFSAHGVLELIAPIIFRCKNSLSLEVQLDEALTAVKCSKAASPIPRGLPREQDTDDDPLYSRVRRIELED